MLFKNIIRQSAAPVSKTFLGKVSAAVVGRPILAAAAFQAAGPAESGSADRIARPTKYNYGCGFNSNAAVCDLKYSSTLDVSTGPNSALIASRISSTVRF